MTNAKVKVSKEVAKAIEELYLEYGGKTPDRVEVITYDIIRVVEMRKVFGGMRLQDVIKAISDGYEIEETPQDIVNNRIKTIKGTFLTSVTQADSLGAEMRGIKLVVDAFNLKGVNA